MGWRGPVCDQRPHPAVAEIDGIHVDANSVDLGGLMRRGSGPQTVALRHDPIG